MYKPGHYDIIYTNDECKKFPFFANCDEIDIMNIINFKPLPIKGSDNNDIVETKEKISCYNENIKDEEEEKKKINNEIGNENKEESTINETNINNKLEPANTYNPIMNNIQVTKSAATTNSHEKTFTYNESDKRALFLSYIDIETKKACIEMELEGDVVNGFK